MKPGIDRNTYEYLKRIRASRTGRRAMFGRILCWCGWHDWRYLTSSLTWSSWRDSHKSASNMSEEYGWTYRCRRCGIKP